MFDNPSYREGVGPRLVAGSLGNRHAAFNHHAPAVHGHQPGVAHRGEQVGLRARLVQVRYHAVVAPRSFEDQFTCLGARLKRVDRVTSVKIDIEQHCKNIQQLIRAVGPIRSKFVPWRLR